MEWIVVFLGGAVAASSALLIGYFGRILFLQAEGRRIESWDARLKAESAELRERARLLVQEQSQWKGAAADFEARKVKYDDLVRENGGLKQDCFNLCVQLKKMELDHATLAKRQSEIDSTANGWAERYLKESVRGSVTN